MCWINVKNKTRITSLFPSNKGIQYVGCKCKISVEINSNVSKMIQGNNLLLFSHASFRKFRFLNISEAICHFSAFGALILSGILSLI